MCMIRVYQVGILYNKHIKHFNKSDFYFGLILSLFIDTIMLKRRNFSTEFKINAIED